jgi:para-aminobenzoate synthetase component 1
MARWPGAPAGVPCAVGYLAYDLGKQLGPALGRLFGRPLGGSFGRSVEGSQATGWPDIDFGFYDAVWVKDGSGGAAQIWACNDAAARRLCERLTGGADEPFRPREDQLLFASAFAPVDPAEQYLAGVAAILDLVRAGDVYQVNLARRLEAWLLPDPGPPGLRLYERLQAESPAPHAMWLATGAGHALIGNSPERFLAVDVAGVIETRPIKGTRARSRRPDANRSTAAALACNPKDLAEHTMIVDLERNDLGRICRTGSVEVADFARVVSLPTVHHLVSTVRGRLRTGVGLAEILRATFPGGSITGAPKIRAMQIIDDLEPARRGPYTGVTGWLGAAGDSDLAIAIRTAWLEDGRVTLWVGGGIVADSDASAEWRETEAKAAAFVRLTRL